MVRGGNPSHFGIKRIETDCSRALISAVLQALEYGPTIVYIRMIWLHLKTARKVPLVYHICRLVFDDIVETVNN